MQDNPRPEKVAVVEEVKERLGAASAALLTEYRGLSVQEIADLRRSLRDAGGEYKIYKNTLVRFAVRDRGLDALEPLLQGPTAVAFVDGDAVTVAKALRDFARTNPNLVVKGGLLGDNFLDAEQAGALAEIPSREVLLARLAGGLAAPLQQLAGLIQALPRNLAYGLKALIDQGGAPGAPASAEPAAETETPNEAAAETETPAEPVETEPPDPSRPSEPADAPVETEPPDPTRPAEPEPAPDTESAQSDAAEQGEEQ